MKTLRKAIFTITLLSITLAILLPSAFATNKREFVLEKSNALILPPGFAQRQSANWQNTSKFIAIKHGSKIYGNSKVHVTEKRS